MAPIWLAIYDLSEADHPGHSAAVDVGPIYNITAALALAYMTSLWVILIKPVRPPCVCYIDQKPWLILYSPDIRTFLEACGGAPMLEAKGRVWRSCPDPGGREVWMGGLRAGVPCVGRRRVWACLAATTVGRPGRIPPPPHHHRHHPPPTTSLWTHYATAINRTIITAIREPAVNHYGPAIGHRQSARLGGDNGAWDLEGLILIIILF